MRQSRDQYGEDGPGQVVSKAVIIPTQLKPDNVITRVAAYGTTVVPGKSTLTFSTKDMVTLSTGIPVLALTSMFSASLREAVKAGKKHTIVLDHVSRGAFTHSHACMSDLLTYCSICLPQNAVIVRIGPSSNQPVNFKKDYEDTNDMWSDRSPDLEIKVAAGVCPHDPYSVKVSSGNVSVMYEKLIVSYSLTMSDIA